MLTKTSFFMWFMHAILRDNLLAILIRLAILIYFDCAPAISITILIISIYFNLFQSDQSILIISIYFDSFWFWHQNCQIISMLRQPFWSFHHVTAKMEHDGSYCHLTFASFAPNMQEYDISCQIWRFSDGKVEKQQ
jgi:hypothetical protein